MMGFFIMAENKKSFLLYCDLIHTVEQMPNELAGELFKHILSYVNDKNPLSENLIINLTFEPIKQSLKRDLIKYESIIEQKRQAGLASAESRKQKQQMSTRVQSVEQRSTKSTDSDSVSDSVKVSVIKKEKEIKKKIPFSQSHIFDKVKFKDEFKEWSNTKLNYYYNSALAWSEEGGKKINWVTTIKNWELRDRLEGKEIAQDKNTMPKQPRID